MKTPYLLLAALCLSLPFCLHAQEEDAAELMEIPTEVSEPPYAIGNLVTESGYYIERGDELPKINFRIVGNKLRVYWIDSNGLIAEPESEAATVRFVGSGHGRSYHRLSLLPEGSGLGAPGIAAPPHLYNVILVFDAAEGEEPVSYSFRYTPALDAETDPASEATPK